MSIKVILSWCMNVFKRSDRYTMKNTEQKEKKGKDGRKFAEKDVISAMFYKHYPSYVAGIMNVSELARVCGLSRPTVYKYLKMVG